jgi:hypothetical protein
MTCVEIIERLNYGVMIKENTAYLALDWRIVGVFGVLFNNSQSVLPIAEISGLTRRIRHTGHLRHRLIARGNLRQNSGNYIKNNPDLALTSPRNFAVITAFIMAPGFAQFESARETEKGSNDPAYA